MMLALQSRSMETSSPLGVLSLLWQLAQRSAVRKSSAGFGERSLRERGSWHREEDEGDYGTQCKERFLHRFLQRWFMINRRGMNRVGGELGTRGHLGSENVHI